eukprot:7569-Heterococcus_DN1.PRE.6
MLRDSTSCARGGCVSAHCANIMRFSQHAEARASRNGALRSALIAHIACNTPECCCSMHYALHKSQHSMQPAHMQP